MNLEALLTALYEHKVFTGAGIVALLSLIQISPLTVNPWSWIWKMIKKLLSVIGHAFNSSIIEDLSSIKSEQESIKEKLESHILSDDYRTFDSVRRVILRFNNEECRGQKHTKEEWIDILQDIDDYLAYCKKNEKYPNTRAECAIDNIRTSYTDASRNGDFLPEGRISKEGSRV